MDDKRFNELMERHVKSTVRGKDLDFQKLRAKESTNTKLPRKNVNINTYHGLAAHYYLH